MPLFKTDESFPERSVVIIIVGTPFSYKTSLAITANKPILFDFEKGAERAHGRTETYRITNSWKEVEDDLTAGLLTPFKTAVIDTGGAVIDDYMWDYGLVLKYTKNLMQNWGTVKDIFKKFVSKIRLAGVDLVVISHEKSKDKNDEQIYDLDISGGGKQLLLRQADQIGFISKKDFKEGANVVTKTILTFWPTANLPFCKNVASLDDIVLPDCKGPEWDGFLDRAVIQPTKKAIREMSEEQVNALNLIHEWRLSLDALEPGEDVEAISASIRATYDDIAKIEPEHIKRQIVAHFTAHLPKMGYKWFKKPVGKFLPADTVLKKDGTLADVQPWPNKQAETPVAEQKPQVEQSESNPGALVKPADEAPEQVINRNPNMAEPANDLFKPVED